MMNINGDLLQWLVSFLIKRLPVERQNDIISNKELAEELYKPIFRKLKGRKLHSRFINNT